MCIQKVDRKAKDKNMMLKRQVMTKMVQTMKTRRIKLSIRLSEEDANIDDDEVSG